MTLGTSRSCRPGWRRDPRGPPSCRLAATTCWSPTTGACLSFWRCCCSCCSTPSCTSRLWRTTTPPSESLPDKSSEHRCGDVNILHEARRGYLIGQLFFFFFFLEASVDWSDRGGIVEVGWFLEAVSGAGHAEKKSSRPDSLQINLLAIMRFNVGLLSLRLHLNVIR